MHTTSAVADVLDITPTSRKPLLQLVVFAAVGGFFNVVYVLMYVLLREPVTIQWANALALVASTIVGTWGHRRVTFGVRGRSQTVRHQVLGLALLVSSLSATAGSLALFELQSTSPSRWAEIAVLTVANLGVGLVRFGVFRAAMVPTSPAAARGWTRSGDISVARGQKLM